MNDELNEAFEIGNSTKEELEEELIELEIEVQNSYDERDVAERAK